jgi:hypothetical protein
MVVEDVAPGPILILPSKKRGAGSPVLVVEDLNRFLEEQTRSFAEKKAEFQKMFPDEGSSKKAKIITFHEAEIIAALSNSQNIAQRYSDCVDYIEEMIHDQLVSALGKEVSPADFTNYMRYHNRKIFKPEFQPRPFSYAVRQPDHFPEGTLGIDQRPDDGSIAEPIPTIVSKREKVTKPMKFALNASTQVFYFC